jgi:hypothetical protein
MFAQAYMGDRDGRARPFQRFCHARKRNQSRTLISCKLPHPAIACAAFIKESRMVSIRVAEVRRKSGVGTTENSPG